MQLSDTDTVKLNEEDPSLPFVEAIDQTLLPAELRVIPLATTDEIIDAIKRLVVRGAPAIGVCAALGLYTVCKRHSLEGNEDLEAFITYMRREASLISEARPTAVNLSWAINRMVKKADDALTSDQASTISDLLSIMHDEAITIYKEDIEVCRSIGEHGLSLIEDGYGLLTHCNAGRLATVRYGTATAPMYLAHEKGYRINVYCDETRPLLQGARLTAYELSASGLDTTLLCDNMSASLMKTGAVNAVFVGCDRVAANGDAANKIGTSMVAAMAKRFGIPFYVCAPISTIDFSIKTGDEIVIEQRDGDEVTNMWYEKPMAPEGISVYNPAFDVTDHSDITAIITEKGVLRPPFDKAISELFAKQ